MNINKIISKDELLPLFYSALLLLLISILGGMFTKTSFSSIFTLSFSIFSYLIIPGYFILLNFKSLDSLERVVLGMVVSSAIVPSLLYAINILGANISKINTISVILVITISSLILKKNEEKE